MTDRTTTDPSTPEQTGYERRWVGTWFLIGSITGIFLMWTQASAVGGWTGLLSVGEDSLLRPHISGELPDLVAVPDEGNDGQIYYAIALDLGGDTVPPLLNDPELRYQRIAYPFVASLGGLLRGYPLFWAMVGLSIVGLGLAAAGIEELRTLLGVGRWIHLGVFLNPGVWLSVRQLTPDMLGLGLCLAALPLAMSKRWFPAVVILSVAALTKESLVLFAGGLALWLIIQRLRSQGLATGTLPVLSVLGWSFGAKALTGGDGRIGGGNWSLPFQGISDATSFWPTTPTREQAMTAIALGIVLVGFVAFVLTRSVLGRCLLLPWLVLPLVTSEWVWRFGNGSLRGFAPIGVLAAIALADRRAPSAGQLSILHRRA